MRKLVVSLAALLVVVMLAGGAAYLLYDRATQPFKGYAEAEQFVDVPPGSGPPTIGERLIKAGVIRDTMAFKLALWRSGEERQLKAGEYRFDRPLTAFEVVMKLARGEVYLRPITFPEGLSIDDMAALYEERGFGTAASFRKAAADVSLVADIDPQARDLEGYLFPETYGLPRRATAQQLVRMMVRRFHQVLAPLAAAVEASGMMTRQVVTLASMVEKETGSPSERPEVAAVYLNRLRIGMGLQCDPTVIYGLRRAGRYNGNLTRDNMAWDSPYNTYIHAGLPPGPIASPGKASLEATLHPAPVDYLYFVSRNDGSHVFARTLEEHNRNVLKFQKQYFHDRRAR